MTIDANAPASTPVATHDVSGGDHSRDALLRAFTTRLDAELGVSTGAATPASLHANAESQALGHLRGDAATDDPRTVVIKNGHRIIIDTTPLHRAGTVKEGSDVTDRKSLASHAGIVMAPSVADKLVEHTGLVLQLPLGRTSGRAPATPAQTIAPRTGPTLS
jgi:hypothetical protein